MRFFANRRLALMKKCPWNCLIVVRAADEALRNGDVYYDFRQNSDFYYLTGIDSPGYALILDPRHRKSILFVPDISLHHHIWVGHQMTPREARKKYCMSEAFPISTLSAVIKSRRRRRKLITLAENAASVNRLIRPLKPDIQILREHLSELRVRKQPDEILWMKKANIISRVGHLAAFRGARPGLFEYELQAVLECEFRKKGSRHNAYNSIVASGPNAAILHYHDNSRRLRAGELVLIDAGAEWQGYAADVTRTFPVSGRFSQRQRAVYETVLAIQKSCIRLLRPGISMLNVHEHACLETIEGLMRLGILRPLRAQEHYQKESYRLFFPHGIGHLLGLDVHDVGEPLSKNHSRAAKSLRTRRPLEKDFVVTIEPGIYFIAAHFNNSATRKKYARYVDWKKADRYFSVGGVRIEDDLLITSSGSLNLTHVPKEVEEIEEIMQS